MKKIFASLLIGAALITASPSIAQEWAIASSCADTSSQWRIRAR